MASTVEPAGIILGISVDKFKLGMGVSETIALISRDYPRLNFEVSFPRAEKVLSQEVIISLLDWGIRLRFLPVSQKLYMIDIYDLGLRAVAIRGTTFGGDKHGVITYDSLHKVLGPAFPGHLIENELYLCSFDGSSFLFQIPKQHLGLVKTQPHLPVIFPDGTSAVLLRIYIYPPLLDIAAPKTYPDYLCADVQVVLRHTDTRLNHSVTIRLSATESANISLGMHPQDIISILGDPNIIVSSPQTMSYRYEYRTYGMEFHMLETSHEVCRIVLKNNLACSSDFGKCERCPFRIFLVPPQLPLLKASNEDDTSNWIQSHNGRGFLSRAGAPGSPVMLDTSRRVIVRQDLGFSTAQENISLPEQSVSAPSKGGPKNGKNGKSAPISENPAPVVAAEKSKKGQSTPQAEISQSASEFDVILGSSLENSFIDPLTEYSEVKELMTAWFGDSESGITPAQLAAPQGSPFGDTLLYGFPEHKIFFEVSDAGYLLSVSLMDIEFFRS